MAQTLERFAEECRRLLSADPGPAGREKVCAKLREALKDEAFLARHLTPETPERKVIYEDPALGFCILAHSYKGAKESTPHDHGPSWAIYGQATGETLMSDFALVERATPEKPGKARATRSYALKPGDAHLYNEGDLHAPKRTGPTGLIRIEGMNMDKVKRLPYVQVA
jgi:predicted metal-dependent enzyme (double-stranded beta helix superfamily)